MAAQVFSERASRAADGGQQSVMIVRHEEDAGLGELLLEGGGDRDRVEHCIDRNARVRAVLALDAGQHLLLAQRNAELGVGLEDFGVDLVERRQRVAAKPINALPERRERRTEQLTMQEFFA